MSDPQLDKFRKIVDQVGQAEVARRTGLSAATINQVYHDKYSASDDAVSTVINTVLEKVGGEKVVQIPAGYMANGQGHLVRIESISEVDMARDELVKEIVGQAKGLSGVMKEFKRGTMGDISAFVELVAEKYEVSMGGNKGNLRLYSFDKKYMVQRQMSDHLIFDERIQVAKALLDEYALELSEGARSEIQTLINDFFQVDKEGNINTNKVLSLRRFDFDGEKWRRAMDIIADSLDVAGSTPYVRVYERDDESGKYNLIQLNMAAI